MNSQEDIHALSGAYAVDAVDDIERAEFERHLATCADCREEVASFRATAVQLSLLISAMPPERLREQVLRDISSVRPLPPAMREEAGERIEATSRERAAAQAAEPQTRVARLTSARHRRNRWLAAAAAVVVLGGGGALAITQPWNSTRQVQTTIAAQVQQAPDAQRFQQTLADGSTVTVVRSKSVGRAVLVTNNLATAPSGKTYQMWLQVPGGSFASAGLVPPGANEIVVLDGDAATALGAGVSVEPAGGSQQPTTTPIALFAFA
ncbi:MAG: anti-sigma factor [Lapillicoccus sp.]